MNISIMFLRNILYMCSDSFGFQLSNETFPNRFLVLAIFQVLDFIKRYICSATPLIAGNSVYMDLLFLKVSKRTGLVISAES